MPSLIRLFKKSLRFKLVSISVMIEVIMLSLLLWNSFRLMSEAVEYHGNTLAEDAVPLLDGALSLVLFERDYSSMIEILNKLVKGGESDIKYITVYDDNGKLYASTAGVNTNDMPVLDENIRAAETDGVYDLSATLTLDDIPVGQVRFGISLERMLESRQHLFQQGALIAGGEIILTILLLSVAGFFLTKHLNLLLEATRKVSRGNYSVRLARTTSDEIGELTENFNEMTLAIRDQIEELKNSEQALFEEKERAQVTLESIGDGVITTDMDGRVELLNPVAEKLTGWKSSEASGKQLRDIFELRNELTNRPVSDPVSRCLETGEVVEITHHTVLKNRSGEIFPIEDSAAPILDRSGKITGAVLVFHDVSGARHLARQMAYQARHDALTGLVNRSEFEERLRHAIDTAGNEGRMHAIFYMDLDQFKIVNDTCGHFAGDELLKQLASLLKEQFREADTLARLGGDEFGVLLENCPEERALNLAEEIRRVVQKFRFEWDGKTFEIGISIGVVIITEMSQSMAGVMSAADMACYMAKDKGRNRVHLHVAGDEEHERRHSQMHMAAEISSALDENRFQIYFQRAYPLNRGLHVTLPHYNELLVRMIDTEGDIVPPYHFISAAEQFQMMHRVDSWVVKNTFSFIKEHESHVGNDIFAINLSGHSIMEDEFLDLLEETIKSSGVAADRICFEITETAAISNLKQAVRFISRIKQLGCKFALDDFGSGLSSFAYLKNLQVDFLKIDGVFVKDVLRDDTDVAIVEAINQIGHILGLKTIAEYVDSKAIEEKMRLLGVDYGQGFGMHEPAPLSDYVKMQS